MPSGTFFWVTMLLLLIGGLWRGWLDPAPRGARVGIVFLVFLALGAVGWAQFGPPIK